jgi:3-dehydroquinate synthetase
MTSSLVPFSTELEQPSPYYLGEEIEPQLPELLAGFEHDRCFLVTSRPLYERMGRGLAKRLRQAGFALKVVLVGDGEREKSWRSLRQLGEALIAGGATKDSLVLALGGGALGNLVGLAASLLYRGVRFVEIPTTLMALTDSTLSNKQAINGRRGKNLFGTYHAPVLIWGDVAYARSEPDRQRRAGVVEGIKNLLITGRGHAAALELIDTWRAGDLLGLTRRLIDSKLPILRADPTERGSAIILEYGHTFGHAIEWLAAGRLFHGEAISIGMCLAAQLSNALGCASDRFVAEHEELLGERLGTPTQLPAELAPRLLLETMHRDNKRSRKGLGYLLLRTWGEFVNPEGDRQTKVEDELVLKLLSQQAAPPTPRVRSVR